MLIIGNGNLITHNDNAPFIENGCVVIEDNLIIDFGETSAIKNNYTNYEFINARGKLIMPGIINTHSHIYSSLARGLNMKNAPVSKNFNDILENLWWKIDNELSMKEVKFSALATYMDSIKHGVTTLFDHHASFNCIENSLFTIAEVAKDLGIRTSLCYEVSDRNGGTKSKLSIKENVDFIEYCNDNKSDMLKAMFGLHASFTISEKTLMECAEYMKSFKSYNTGFHVHTAEGIGDVHDSLTKYNKRVVEHLFNNDILGKNTIAVHCVHVNNREIDILKETDTIVVHNPQSNMGNAVGTSPILKIMEKGILTGMGTDAYTNDVLESMKTENILHKHDTADPSVSWGEPPTMTFKGNKDICSRFFDKPLGVIEKNALADVIIVDYIPHTPMNETNINGHLQFGVLGSQTTHSIINGQVIMRDRVLQNIDDEKTLAECRIVAKGLWDRL